MSDTTASAWKLALLAARDAAVALALALVVSVLLALLGSSLASARIGAGLDPFAKYVAWRLETVSPAEARSLLGEVSRELADLAPAPSLSLSERDDALWIEGYFAGDDGLARVSAALRQRGAWSGGLQLGTRWSVEMERLAADPASAVSRLRILGPWLFAATPLSFLTAGLVLRRRRPAPGWERSARAVMEEAPKGVAVGLVGAASTWLLESGLRATGVPQPEQAWLTELARGGIAGAATLVAVAVVLAPLAEELFFRGHLFRFVCAGSRPAAAYAVSTALFALVHFHAALVPSYVVLGLLLAWTYERSRSLAAPVAAHATVNAIGVGLLLAG